VDSDSPTPITLVNRLQIEQTPGASRANSLASITDYRTRIVCDAQPTPHSRWPPGNMAGGRCPVANTNIADSVGPQFDPKDVDYLEVQRGSYTASTAIAPMGFSMSCRAAALNASVKPSCSFLTATSIRQRPAEFGDHTKRFAYYASINGNRSGYGLETPVSRCCTIRATALAPLLL